MVHKLFRIYITGGGKCKLLQDMHGGGYYLVMTSSWTFKDTVLPRLLLEDLLGNSQVVGLYTERKWTKLHMCTFVQKHLSAWYDTLFAMGIAAGSGRWRWGWRTVPPSINVLATPLLNNLLAHIYIYIYIYISSSAAAHPARTYLPWWCAATDATAAACRWCKLDEHVQRPPSHSLQKADGHYRNLGLCREQAPLGTGPNTLGTAHSTPLGRHMALYREPPQMLSAQVCREPLGSRQRKFFQIKKISAATRATGQHRRPHRSVAAATPAPPPSPPQLRCPHHHSTTAAARAHHHHCHAHTVDATTTMRTPPPPSTHHHHLRRHRVHTTTVAAQKKERAGGEKGEGPVTAPGRGRRSQSRRGGATRSVVDRREGRAVGEPPDSPWGSRRRASSFSTAITPRPAAAPRHEVRGERRGRRGRRGCHRRCRNWERERGREAAVWGRRWGWFFIVRVASSQSGSAETGLSGPAGMLGCLRREPHQPSSRQRALCREQSSRQSQF
jgi:hypothetical protein